MTESSHSRMPVGEFIILVAFLVGTALYRIHLIEVEPLNADEIFLIGGAFRVHSGMLPYLDYIEAHTPFIYKLYASFFTVLAERNDVVDCFRWVHLVWISLFQVVLFFVVRKAFRSCVALWSLCILNSFVFFMERTVHVRPDIPAYTVLLVSLWLCLGGGGLSTRRGTYFLVTVSSALAFSLHLTVGFSVGALFAWLVTYECRDRPFGARLLLGLLLVGGFVGVYIAICFTLFGQRVFDALFRHIQMFHFDHLYLSSFHIDSVGIFKGIVRASPVSWFLVGCALVVYNTRFVGGRLKNPSIGLYLLLTDLGVCFLVARDNNFEQHYFALVIFGSVLAALAIREVVGRPGILWGWMRRSGCGFGLAFLLAVSSVAAFRQKELRIESLARVERLPQCSTIASAIESEGTLKLGALRQAWLREGAISFDPFLSVPKKHREAQLRFLLMHSKPDEVVFSDWLNPPYRNLPAPYHHGYMISLFYKSHRLSQDPELVRLIHRYDPYYRADDPGPGERMVRLFEATRPVVILVDGSIAELLVTSERFGQWLSERYTFVFDPESASLFALRLS
jgi:hypothetical protein